MKVGVVELDLNLRLSRLRALGQGIRRLTFGDRFHVVLGPVQEFLESDNIVVGRYVGEDVVREGAGGGAIGEN